uniref:Uncharacterized protein n=1 Tax=Cacopsylla melanoneura TaxID=428564 RepID=A0A8D8R8V0_9HEMI
MSRPASLSPFSLRLYCFLVSPVFLGGFFVVGVVIPSPSTKGVLADSTSVLPLFSPFSAMLLLCTSFCAFAFFGLFRFSLFVSLFSGSTFSVVPFAMSFVSSLGPLSSSFLFFFFSFSPLLSLFSGLLLSKGLPLV